ncbi:uncharacterized protein LOC126732736 isoform X3 [Quercus robur]|uniref:uncharacterized protein LOC126732736 isoform X3 n=1 Tax=Quercus robur TaxID=38942 RepID=UPI002162741C|nr:uncharacterized protein LOC126732736 isoform X3 [Quercus robur]
MGSRIREEGEHWRLDSARTHLPQTHSHPISLSAFISISCLGACKVLSRIKETKRCSRFLKLPQMVLTSWQIKIHKWPLSDNWEDVYKTLTGYSNSL